MEAVKSDESNCRIKKGRRLMRVLIADDEIEIAKALKVLLERSCFLVDIVFDGTGAWDAVRCTGYDVIVLDIMMPGMDGLNVLKKLREAGNATPVLLLTAKAEVEDKVRGLDAGADDYLPKPFAFGELAARVKALSRRSAHYADHVRTLGNMVLDCNSYEIRVGDKRVRLSNKEYQLMELFMRHPHAVFSTQHLMDVIWGENSESGMDVVWTHIGFLRKKLRQSGADVEIRTARGAGYFLEESGC